MNWLKNLLSEKTYQTLTEKLGTDLVKSISEKTSDFTIDTAEEKFIPKGKFDEERNRVKDLTEQLKARDGQLNELQKSAKGNEELTKQLEALKDANAKQIETYNKQLAEREKNYAIETALFKSGAKNNKSVIANLDLSKIELVDGNLKGLDDQVKTLKESDAYLFNIDTSKDGAGKDPKTGKQTSTNKDDRYAAFRNLR